LSFAPLNARAETAVDSFQNAVDGERKILANQKDQLARKLERFASESEQYIAQEMERVELLQRQLELLERKTRETAAENDKMADMPDAGDPTPVYDATLAQMDASISKLLGVFSPVGLVKKPSIPESGLKTAQERLALGLKVSLGVLEKGGTIRSREGEFFLPNGAKANGIIREIGYVAAFVESSAAKGSLVPAGDGLFKLLRDEPYASIEGLLSSGSKERVSLFLFESREKAVQVRKEKTLRETLSGGGPVAYVLVALGLVTLALILVKGAGIVRASRNSDVLVSKVAELLRDGRIGEALALSRGSRGAYGRVVEVTVAALGKGRKVLEDAVAESILREGTRIDRFGSIIVVIAAAAPLLGLLGTVSGMIHTFEVITEFGENDPKLLSAGISEALIDTMLGLVVAIPALLFGNILSNWVERVKEGLEKATLHILTAHAEHQIGESSGV
jgi:biopolymer transport protein ExbB